MKGYFDSTKKILYVFPQTAAEIPYVDPTAEAIYVQQENYAEWATANSEYTSIMKKYNYNLITVNKLVWADHLDDDITAPYHTITLGSHAGDYVEVDKETAEAGETITITPKTGYTVTNVNVATNPLVELTIVEGTWVFTMPDSDITVISSLDNHTITYDEVGGVQILDGPNTAIDGETVYVTIKSELSQIVDFDTVILDSLSGLVITKDYVNNRWEFTMLDENVEIYASVLQKKTFTLENNTLSSFQIYNNTTGSVIQSGDRVLEGNELQVTIVDTTTYSFDPTDTGKTILYPYNVDGSYHTAEYIAFPMPAVNANLVIDNLSTCLYTVSGTEASNVNLLVNDQQINSGDFVYPREHCKLTPDTGYTFNTESTSGDTILVPTFTGVTANYEGEGDYYYFDMVNGDVNAAIEEYTPAAGPTITMFAPISVTAGDTFTANVTTSAPAGLSSFKVRLNSDSQEMIEQLEAVAADANINFLNGVDIMNEPAYSQFLTSLEVTPVIPQSGATSFTYPFGDLSSFISLIENQTLTVTIIAIDTNSNSADDSSTITITAA